MYGNQILHNFSVIDSDKSKYEERLICQFTKHKIMKK